MFQGPLSLVRVRAFIKTVSANQDIFSLSVKNDALMIRPSDNVDVVIIVLAI